MAVAKTIANPVSIRMAFFIVSSIYGNVFGTQENSFSS
jgi:hypothetical protein